MPIDRLRMYQDALGVQNACNLMGVARSFAMAAQQIPELITLEGGPHGTSAVNRHPLMVLWISKLAELSGNALACDPDGGDPGCRAYVEILTRLNQYKERAQPASPAAMAALMHHELTRGPLAPEETPQSEYANELNKED